MPADVRAILDERNWLVSMNGLSQAVNHTVLLISGRPLHFPDSEPSLWCSGSPIQAFQFSEPRAFRTAISYSHWLRNQFHRRESYSGGVLY